MYKLNLDSDAISYGRMSFIAGCGNTEDLEYQAWLAEGNTPEPAETPEEISIREQQEINVTSRDWLVKNDWKFLRHLRQERLGSKTSMTETEFQAYLVMCDQRAALVKD